jgi:CheY-like chemotaxis protein
MAVKDKAVKRTSLDFDKAKVLIVDDIESNRKLIADALEKSNLILHEAVSGQDAMDSVVQDKPDLILMDLRMPGMDGMTAAGLLRKNKKTRFIPIIALSASVKAKQKEEAPEVIFDDYLTKPIDVGELLEIVKKHLKYKETDEVPAGEKIPEPDAEISEEHRKKLPGLIIALENDFYPRYEVIISEKQIDPIKLFAQELLRLGETYSSEAVVAYAKQIVLYSKTFEVAKLMKTLSNFPALMKELKSLTVSK